MNRFIVSAAVSIITALVAALALASGNAPAGMLMLAATSAAGLWAWMARNEGIERRNLSH